MQTAPPGGAETSIVLGRSAGLEEGILGLSAIELQEVERRRIAQEIHDVVGQALTVVRLSLVAARASADRSVLDRHLDECLDMIELALDQVRAIARDLRPAVLDDLGLVAALRGYLHEQAALGRFEPTLRVRSNKGRPPADIETACFRIVQEAVTNVQRHAAARHVEVELGERDSELDLRISDDGRGFDVRAAFQGAASRGSLGLIGMHERALLAGGEIAFCSEPGRGTEIRARFPGRPGAAVAGPG